MKRWMQVKIPIIVDIVVGLLAPAAILTCLWFIAYHLPPWLALPFLYFFGFRPEGYSGPWP